ncbi:MAG: hypothetical protein IJZ74_00855 [Clostridia bacterium]|nr:hypothetical protein [Clostridia bacterium]
MNRFLTRKAQPPTVVKLAEALMIVLLLPAAVMLAAVALQLCFDGGFGPALMALLAALVPLWPAAVIIRRRYDRSRAIRIASVLAMVTDGRIDCVELEKKARLRSAEQTLLHLCGKGYMRELHLSAKELVLGENVPPRQMKCPMCGAPVNRKNGAYCCMYCGTLPNGN